MDGLKGNKTIKQFQITQYGLIWIRPIYLGCNVNCPTVSCRHREDWGLEDPTGKSDEEFQKTIKLIDSKIMDLANRIKVDFITQSVV